MSFHVKKILKFGGTSVENSDRIKNVIQIIHDAAKKEGPDALVVVVSALGGVTENLIALGKSAVEGADQTVLWDRLKNRHYALAQDLIPADRQAKVVKFLDGTFGELSSFLEGIFHIKELTSKSLDILMSYGERLSAFIISEALKSRFSHTFYLDARDIIKTDRTFGEARVNAEETGKKIREYFSQHHGLAVITGFIGSSQLNETTTLGRGGSDLTASLVGAALDVHMIEIWTDVDGILTADPRKEEYAFPIPQISYKEAMEMSHFGAKVIHPLTITPPFLKGIPILIKNSLNPKAPGTLISTKPAQDKSLIRGISSIDQIALLCLQGSGMVGVCGIAKRLFGALAEKGISVILISQGSSEHSICFAIQPKYVDAAVQSIHNEFALEMQAHLVDEPLVEQNMSVIAVVGENMRNTPGISGKLFGALGKNGINVSAIAQGSSELNISLVVKKADEIKAIRTIHEAFFLSPKNTLNLFLAGTGLIGSTLLDLLHKNAKGLLEKHSLDIRLVGLSNSKRMLFDPKGIPPEQGKSLLEKAEGMTTINAFVDHLLSLNLLNSVFVDCTSSQAVSDTYEKVIKGNASIVTPNKKANSGSYEQYKKLKDLVCDKRITFAYGANVGAGLPILSTINELRRSGDRILKIEAILSGTLSYLFNTFNGERPFSEIVKMAKQKGYTEPDPRDDLNGMDVARKLLILSRESGVPLEMEDISIQRFLTDDCFQTQSLEAFFAKLQEQDDRLAALSHEAQSQDKRLRYIATLENGKGSISLKAVDIFHPFFHVSGSENIVAITSEFYRECPLVIKGPGAGAEVTAGKVLADIVRLGLP